MMMATDLTGDPQFLAGLGPSSMLQGGTVMDENQPVAAYTAGGSSGAFDRPPGLHGVVEPVKAMETKPLPDNPIEINNPVTDADRAIPADSGFGRSSFGPAGGFPEQAPERESNIAEAASHNVADPIGGWTGEWEQT
jgi:hypothetical protein